MKQLFSMAAVAAVATADGCLYCRRMDKNSGALVTWSYCKQTDSCLQNVWNYITRTCGVDKLGWQKAGDYDLDYCGTVEAECPSFVSS